MVDDDDYFDDGFVGYVETTVDPGPWVLVGTTVYCAFTIIALPMILILYRRRRQKRSSLDLQFEFIDATSRRRDDQDLYRDTLAKKKQSQTNDKSEETNLGIIKCTSEESVEVSKDIEKAKVKTVDNSSDFSSSTGSALAKLALVTDCVNKAIDDMVQGSSSPLKRIDTKPSNKNHDVHSVGSRSVDSSVSSMFSRGIRPHSRFSRNLNISNRSHAIHKALYHEKREDRLIISGKARRLLKSSNNGYSIQSSHLPKLNSSRSIIAPSLASGSCFVSELYPEDAVDANDPGKYDVNLAKNEYKDYSIFCGPNPCWSPAVLTQAFWDLVDLAEYDSESARLVKLAVPMTIAEVLDAVFENIQLALIAKNISTDSVAAFAVAGLFIELTDTFVKGIPDAENTNCSHAIGCGNYYLAGQYVQIALLLYVIFSIPGFGIWWYYMGSAVSLLGLSDRIARYALEFTRIEVFSVMLNGIAEALFAILDITDHEDYVAALYIISGLLETGTIGIFLIYWDGDLNSVAWIHLVYQIMFLGFGLGYSIFRGWYRRYLPGMFQNLAIRNTAAFNTIFRTSIPLMFGQLLAYGEWEILTIFASYLGPAEVAAWAILGTLWDMFEASTEGMGEAAAIRIAHHLGNNNPRMAKISSYKSSLYGMILAFGFTALFFICGENIPIWFTNDPTLQHFISDLLPLVGIGNLTLTFGMLAWNQLGGQGRYSIATTAHLACSWSITLPLSALSVYVFNFNLEGLAGSVVVGFATAAMIMAFMLMISDWERFSVIIQELNALEDADCSSSYDSSSDDSSSSSDDS